MSCLLFLLLQKFFNLDHLRCSLKYLIPRNFSERDTHVHPIATSKLGHVLHGAFGNFCHLNIRYACNVARSTAIRSSNSLHVKWNSNVYPHVPTIAKFMHDCQRFGHLIHLPYGRPWQFMIIASMKTLQRPKGGTSARKARHVSLVGPCCMVKVANVTIGWLSIQSTIYIRASELS